MTPQFTYFNFERRIRDGRIELARRGFTLDIQYAPDLDDCRVMLVADRNGDNYVFFTWAELGDLTEILDDISVQAGGEHGL